MACKLSRDSFLRGASLTLARMNRLLFGDHLQWLRDAKFSRLHG
jgi:hypothetical protein